MAERYIMVCPKCKSQQVSRNSAGFMQEFGGAEEYVCNECGFSGSFFPEILVPDTE